MRRNWRNKRKYLTIIFLLLLIASCNRRSDHAEHDAMYTCPMHPTVVSEEPGTCPVCGMDLVRKSSKAEEMKIDNDLSVLLRSPNQVVVSSIKTVKPQFRSVPQSVNATGIVAYDTRNIYAIPARVSGRIEQMYVKYEFQPVDKNQKIADIYSPELITAERELLYLLENDRDNFSLIDASKRKLALLGLSPSQINEIVERKKVSNVFTIYSPYDGYVITREVGAGDLPLSNEEGNESMGRMSTSPTLAENPGAPQGILVREGDYISSGQVLVKIVQSKGVRIELDLPGTYTGMVNRGDTVQLGLETKRAVYGHVDLVQPFFDKGQNFLKIRVNTKKSESLYIGKLIEATLRLPGRESLWIPKNAVRDLGTGMVVFVKERDVFKPKKIITGIRTEDLIEVTEGLASSDEIASSAQYLVDTESFIKPVQP